ncbi:MAG: hypothetical protein KDD70_13095, partial [Bdellovibrionales bacterium]|nr:hypothetical protein [Bdellovibrionales bacterium]
PDPTAVTVETDSAFKLLDYLIENGTVRSDRTRSAAAKSLIETMHEQLELDDSPERQEPHRHRLLQSVNSYLHADTTNEAPSYLSVDYLMKYASRNVRLGIETAILASERGMGITPRDIRTLAEHIVSHRSEIQPRTTDSSSPSTSEELYRSYLNGVGEMARAMQATVEDQEVGRALWRFAQSVCDENAPSTVDLECLKAIPHSE